MKITDTMTLTEHLNNAHKAVLEHQQELITQYRAVVTTIATLTEIVDPVTNTDLLPNLVVKGTKDKISLISILVATMEDLQDQFAEYTDQDIADFV